MHQVSKRGDEVTLLKLLGNGIARPPFDSGLKIVSRDRLENRLETALKNLSLENVSKLIRKLNFEKNRRACGAFLDDICNSTQSR
jgi:hypothetical protein